MDNEITKEVLVVKQLTQWEQCPRPTITLDRDCFSTYFSFLSPRHTIHDKQTGDPIFFVFGRDYAIKEVKAHYRLARGTLQH